MAVFAFGQLMSHPRDYAPVPALSGDMPRKMEGTDFSQSTTSDLLFRDVSPYTETILTPSQTAMVIHQAIAAAYAGPGIGLAIIPANLWSRAATWAV